VGSCHRHDLNLGNSCLAVPDAPCLTHAFPSLSALRTPHGVLNNKTMTNILYYHRCTPSLLWERDTQLGFPSLPPTPLPICLSSCGLRDMEARLIPVLVGGRAPIFVVYRNMFRVCVLLRKVKRWRLNKDEIKSSQASLHFGDASNTVGWLVEVCHSWISLDLICAHSVLHFSLLVVVHAHVCWSFRILARQVSICVL
jgi:hypothetical protein